MRYEFSMIETRSYSVVYEVEASTIAEAENMALRGETVSEDFAHCEAVIDREIMKVL